MVQLDLDNVYLKITGLEKDEEMKLWNLLSFPVQVFGMQEVRYRHLYNRKTKKTYAGLLEYVEGHLKDRNIKYILKDNRIKPQQNANFKLVDYIDNEKKIPLKLRPYQQDIVDKCREREVIQAATGAGKALPLDTDILTPNGFVKMRDIHVGSVVYDATKLRNRNENTALKIEKSVHRWLLSGHGADCRSRRAALGGK